MNSAIAPIKKSDARWAKTRQKLLDGGRKVFAEQGVDTTSVLDIIRAAGVSQPSFYNHFESKDALAGEIASEYFRRDKKRKQRVFDEVEDPALAIAINVSQTLSVAVDDPVIAWTLVRSQSLRELMVSADNDSLVSMIKAGVEQKRFLVSNPRTLAITVRGGALAVVQDILNGAADRQASAQFQELVLRMLGLPADECAGVVQHAAGLISQFSYSPTDREQES